MQKCKEAFHAIYKLDGKESKKLNLEDGFPAILTDAGITEETLHSNLAYSLYKALKDAPKAKSVKGLIKVVSRPSEVDLKSERVFPRAVYGFKELYLTVKVSFTVPYTTLYKRIASRFKGLINLSKYSLPNYSTAAKLFAAVVKYWEETRDFYDPEDYEDYCLPKVLQNFEGTYSDFVREVIEKVGIYGCGWSLGQHAKMLLALFALEAAGVDDYTFSRYKSAVSRLWSDSDVLHDLRWTKAGLKLEIDPLDPWHTRDEYFDRERSFYSRLSNLITDSNCYTYFTTQFPVDYTDKKLRDYFLYHIEKEHPGLKKYYGRKFKAKMMALYDFFAKTQSKPISQHNPAIFNYSPIFNSEFTIMLFTPGCIPATYTEHVDKILIKLISLYEEDKLHTKITHVEWRDIRIPMCGKHEFIGNLVADAKKFLTYLEVEAENAN